MSPLGIAQFLISGLMVVTAIILAEAKNLVRAAIAFFLFSLLTSLLFWSLSATYAAIFQLAIYAGFISVLIFVALGLTKGGEEG